MSHDQHFVNGSWPRRDCVVCRAWLSRERRPNPDAGREPPWSYNPEETLGDDA